MKVGELNALIKLDGKNQFDRDLDGAGRKLGSLGDTALRAGQSMATIGVAAGTAMLGLTTAVFKTGVEYNALQQSSRAALTTLLGSAEAANAQMDKLDDFASNSPFAKDVFIRAQQQLIGFGVAAEDVIPILGAVQDATAAVGGSNQDIADIVTTLSKISSTGKITAQDLNELGNKGIDAAMLMGQEFGKSGAEIRDDISNSRISAEDAIDAIVNQMTVKFGGAAANVKETWDGATDRVKAAWRDIGSELAAPFVDPNGGGRAIQWVNDLADVMRAMQKKVAPLMDVVMTRWGTSFDKITPYLQDLKAKIDALDMSALNKGLDALDGYGPIISGLAAAFTAWGTAAVPIIGGMNPIVAGVTALVLATPQLRDGLGGVLTAAAPLVAQLGELGVQVADIAMKVLTDFAPAFFDLAEAVVHAATPLGGAMLDAISGLLTLATPFIDLLSGIVSWMSELPDGVLLAGAAFLMLKDNMSPLKGVVDTVRGAFDNFQLQRHLGQMDGMGTASATASIAMNGLRTSVQKVGTALKTAFMSNAPALAIAGLVTVLGHFSRESADAKAYVGALADSFDEVTGAATDASRALVAEELQGTNLSRVWGVIGEDASDLTEALLGNEEAAARVNAVFAEMRDAGVQGSDGIKYTSFQAEELADKFVELGGRTEEARDEYAEYQALVGDTSGTEEAIGANDRLTDILHGQTGALESLIDARRREQGEAATYADAQVSHSNAIDTMTRAIEDETIALDKSTGTWDAYTQAGQYAIDGSKQTRDSMLEMAEALSEQGKKVDDIVPQLAEMREGYILSAMEMGATREQAEALADSYGLFPEVIATEAHLDASAAELTLADLLIEISESEEEVTIAGNRAKIDQTLGEVIGDVDESDGTVTINGNRLPADMTVDQLLRMIDTSEEDVKINADDQKGQRKLLGFESDVRGAEEFAKINATDSKAQTVLSGTERDIKNTQANVKIGANSTPLNNWIAGMAGKVLTTAYINVAQRQIGGSGGAKHMATPVADGAIFEAFAHGGVREHHVAQIAPAGAWRVWAEPETGGEAYIPLALAKRSRSEAILAEVADRFGMMLMPATAHQFVTGGAHAAPPSPSRATSSIDSGLPRHVVLQIGDREISGLIREVAGEHPGVKAANDLVAGYSRRRKVMG